MQIWGSVPCKTRGVPPIPKQKQQLCSDFNFFFQYLYKSRARLSFQQGSIWLLQLPSKIHSSNPRELCSQNTAAKWWTLEKGVPTEFCLICRAGVTPYRKFIRRLYLKKKMLKYIKYPQCTEASARRAQPPETAKFIWEQLLTQELKSFFLPLQKFFIFKGLQHSLFLF